MTAETISALVNLGSAGAVIAVVIIFLGNIKERDKEWRDFFTALAGGNQQDIQDMRQTATRLTNLLEDLLKNYNSHDTQAKAIAAAVAEIRLELARINPRPATRGKKQ